MARRHKVKSNELLPFQFILNVIDQGFGFSYRNHVLINYSGFRREVYRCMFETHKVFIGLRMKIDSPRNYTATDAIKCSRAKGFQHDA